MNRPRSFRGRRVRFAPFILASAVLSSTILGASVTGTLSAFTASITNSTNTASSSSLVMKETTPDSNSPTATCLSTDSNTTNSATCSTINKYGASTLKPGQSATPTSVRMSNLGNATVGTFTLAPVGSTNAGCTTATTNTSLASSSGNLCTKLYLYVTCISSASGSTSQNVIGTAAGSTSGGVALASLATSYTIPSACIPAASAATYTVFTFNLYMDSAADATVQNQTVTQGLLWTFTGA